MTVIIMMSEIIGSLFSLLVQYILSTESVHSGSIEGLWMV